MFDQYLPTAHSLSVFDVHVTSTVLSCTPLLKPGVVPPQLLVRFYTSAILLLYYGLSLYLRSSALCHLGSNTSRSDACLSCDANQVHLPATTRSVWIQRTYHQRLSGCHLISNRLPRLPSKLDVIIVRKEGTDQSHRDFHVRINVVHRALQWLVMHNKYYRANNVCIDGNALDQLPEGGNLVQLRVIAIDSPATDSPTSTTYLHIYKQLCSYNQHFTRRCYSHLQFWSC